MSSPCSIIKRLEDLLTPNIDLLEVDVEMIGLTPTEGASPASPLSPVTSMQNFRPNCSRSEVCSARSGGGRGSVQEDEPISVAGPSGPSKPSDKLLQSEPASPPKTVKKASPVRISCPLTARTLKEPLWLKKRKHEIAGKHTISGPPSKKVSFVDMTDISTTPEKGDHVEPIAGGSWMEDPVMHCPVTPTATSTSVESKVSEKKIVMLPPCTNMKSIKDLQTPNIDLLKVYGELIGFTPTEGTSPASSLSPASINDEIEQLESTELDVSENGSDIDDDNDCVTHGNQMIKAFPCDCQDTLPTVVVDQLQIIDDQDSAALKQIVDNNEMLHFDWRNEADVFKGTREVFTGKAGPTFSTAGMTPIAIFEKIWDNQVMSLIVQETNRYANQLLDSSELKRYQRMAHWKNINKNDIWMFFAVMMLQAFVPNPVEKQFWFPALPYLKIGSFNQLMSFRKFLLIKRCLHFVNNLTTDKDNKLAKIQPIVDHLNKTFGSLYKPEQCIAIDESLMLCKGRLSFAQRIATKAARVGVKSYELCESRTGYLWRMLIYTCKGHKDAEEPKEQDEACETTTSQIVFKLLRPLLNKGHTLVMDNFYNSPLLSRTLKKKKTDTMGTLRLSREFVPKSLRQLTKKDMRTGEVAFSQTHDLSVVVWRDNSLVALLSTYHPVEVGGKEKDGYYKFKPQVVLDYNMAMGGIDRKDQLLQAYPIDRIRNAVWYKKLFRRLLNVSVLNSQILYNHNRESTIAQREFREILVDQIIKKYGRDPLTSQAAPRHLTQKIDHFPIRIKGRSRCKWCAEIKKETRTVYKCDTCDVALCVDGCFREFHINKSNQFNNEYATLHHL